MTTRNLITPEQIKRARKLMAQGHTQDMAAKAVNISYTRLSQILSGYKRKRRRSSTDKYSMRSIIDRDISQRR